MPNYLSLESLCKDKKVYTIQLDLDYLSHDNAIIGSYCGTTYLTKLNSRRYQLEIEGKLFYSKNGKCFTSRYKKIGIKTLGVASTVIIGRNGDIIRSIQHLPIEEDYCKLCKLLADGCMF